MSNTNTPREIYVSPEPIYNPQTDMHYRIAYDKRDDDREMKYINESALQELRERDKKQNEQINELIQERRDLVDQVHQDGAIIRELREENERLKEILDNDVSFYEMVELDMQNQSLQAKVERLETNLRISNETGGDLYKRLQRIKAYMENGDQEDEILQQLKGIR